MGVSTSRKPRSSSHPRTAETTAARVRNSSLVSGFAIRSSSRCRWRSSTSSSPWYLSGGGRRLFASRVQPSSRSESSPRLVANTAPSAPMMSPRSRPTRRSKDSSPRTSCAGVELDPPGAIDEIEEGRLPVATSSRQPARHAVAVLRLLAGGQALVRRADIRDLASALELVGKGLDIGLAKALELLAPLGDQTADSGRSLSAGCCSGSLMARRAYLPRRPTARGSLRLTRSW